MQGDPNEELKRNYIERHYLDRFSAVSLMDKEKGIKFFKAIGDPYICSEHT